MDEVTYVGIDVSKARLDVAMLPGREAFAVTNTGAGIEQLVTSAQPDPGRGRAGGDGRL